MIYFTSDSHFNHQNIIKYCNRPFASVEEMNEALIANWNSVVKPEDTVYVLGDFILGQANTVEIILSRLNGTVILVRGNHDTRTKLQEYERLGIEVKDIAYVPYKGRYFICCHFPIASEEFIKMVIEDNSEVVNLYGHIHEKAPKGYVNGTYHVGVDTNNFTPISIEQIWKECWPEEIMTPEITAYKIAHDLNPNLEDQGVRRGQRAYAGLYTEYVSDAITQVAAEVIKPLTVEELLKVAKEADQAREYKQKLILNSYLMN